MNFVNQVRHVALKDFRDARSAMAVYVVLVAGVTVHIAGWLSVSGIPQPWWTAAVVLVGMVAAAMVLLADPPGRTDALWASRPLAPTAIVLAKLVVMVALVLIGAIGQLVALSSFGVHFTSALVQSGRAVLTFMTLLLVALVIAAATRDIKTVFLVLIAIPIMMIGGAFMHPISVSADAAALIGASRATLTAAVSLAALVWLYRTRDVRVSHRALACIAVMALSFGPPGIRAAEPGVSTNELVDAPRVHITLGRFDESRAGKDLSLRATVDSAPEAYSLQFTDWQVTVFGPDTSFTSIGNGPVMLADDSRPEIAGARWMSERSFAGGVGFNASLTASQRILLARGIDSVEITGSLVILQSLVAASVPVVERTRLASGGWRFYIEDLAHDGQHASLDLRTSSVQQGEQALTPTGFAAPFALVNRGRAQAIELNSSGGGGTGGSLVLPGPTLESYTYALSTEDRLYSPNQPTIDATWLAGAELIAIRRLPRAVRPFRSMTWVESRAMPARMAAP